MNSSKKKRTFKKRYILIPLLLLFIGLIGFLHWAANQMATPERDQITYFEKNESVVPEYIDYQANGRNIHLAEIPNANPDAPVLIMFHGSPGALDNYLIYLADDTLQQAATLIAVDRPGFGKSDPGKVERSLENEAALFKPILEQYRDQKVILMGHSYGGPVIARLAMDYPDLVDGLVMVAGSISPELEPPIWWRHIIDWWAIRWILPSNFTVSNQEILPLKVELEYMMPLWKQITAPLLVVQGTTDNLVPAGNADFAYKMMPPELVELDMIENGSHFILWTEKDRITNHLLHFLEAGSDQ